MSKKLFKNYEQKKLEISKQEVWERLLSTKIERDTQREKQKYLNEANQVKINIFLKLIQLIYCEYMK